MYKKLLFVFIFGTVGLMAQAQTGQEPVATSVTPAQTTEEKPVEEVAADGKAEVEVLEKDVTEATTATPEETKEEFVAARESVQEAPAPVKKNLVVYQPKNRRDPTLSPDDFLLLQYREQQRLAALEAERQRQLAEERRRQEEEERLRQLELARIKDPTREVRNRIKIGGIVGQEVFIGDKVYTVGNKIFGARIVEVTPDSVVFSYKGHKFVRKMQ